MNIDRQRDADREEALGRIEHEMENWLHRLAGVMRNPDATRKRANQMAETAERHLKRAEQLREHKNGGTPKHT
jgi:hypothetical protein